jgi:hypothetical protein
MGGGWKDPYKFWNRNTPNSLVRKVIDHYDDDGDIFYHIE